MVNVDCMLYLRIHLILILFILSTDYSCSVKHVKAGCFNDKTKPSLRAMSELLFQDRSDKGKSFSGKKVDWNNWNTYLPE